MNDPRYLHTEEKQEGETFFDVMNRLIARSKAVTADMEAVSIAELESDNNLLNRSVRFLCPKLGGETILRIN
ncbi:MAG: hypothetical protein V8S39_03610 [Lachnospiraceae bacterium]